MAELYGQGSELVGATATKRRVPSRLARDPIDRPVTIAAEARMRIEASRVVNAPPEAVWAIVTDLAETANVIEAIESIEVLQGPDPLAVGTRWRESRTMFGKTASEEMEVTELDPGRSYTVEAGGRGGGKDAPRAAGVGAQRRMSHHE